MSSLLIKSATIADPGGPLHGKKLDLFIENGILIKAEKEINSSADQTFIADGKFVSPGFTDIFSICGEPGEEWKEDLFSLANAAAAGGFTRVAIFGSSKPAYDQSAMITALRKKSANLGVEIMPVGAATKGCNGKELAEYFDMKENGAVAISDGLQPIENAGMRSRIMEYAANTDIPFIDFPLDHSLAPHGAMHDGVVSNEMGLKGFPVVSETSSISEAIQIGAWLKIPVRLMGISAKESLQLIREAKSKGQEIYAAVPALNLMFTDENLKDFDENCKVLPPLRSEDDRVALIAAVKDGTIDAVYSNHSPQDTESKTVEFEYAAFGVSQIQWVFYTLCSAEKGNFDADILVRALAQGPAKMLGLNADHVETGKSVSLSIFDLKTEFVITPQNHKSKGKNSPLMNRKMNGKIWATICKGSLYISEENSTQKS